MAAKNAAGQSDSATAACLPLLQIALLEYPSKGSEGKVMRRRNPLVTTAIERRIEGRLDTLENKAREGLQLVRYHERLMEKARTAPTRERHRTAASRALDKVQAAVDKMGPLIDQLPDDGDN